MEKKGISQEEIKLIACVTMLMDHIGAVLMPHVLWLRVIGRISFPLYCFLLVEGVNHSRNLKRYGQRLLIGVVMAELIFDLTFFGKVTGAHQSVMITLFIGFLMLVWEKKTKRYFLPTCICFFAAEYLRCDYGGWGIVLISMFWFTMRKPHAGLLQMIGMLLIFWCMDSASVYVGELRVPVQLFGVLAVIPIALYSGEKRTDSILLQTGFYLFYPVHMAVLFLIDRII